MGKGKAYKKNGLGPVFFEIDDLEKQPTRVLLQALREINIAESLEKTALASLSPEERADIERLARIEESEAREARGDRPSSPSLSYKACLKAELAKRPHVQNKPEAKVLRQQRAKEQRSR